MRAFVIVGNKAATTPNFTLKDMPGSAGRLDVLVRCVNSAFFLSHDIRRDVILYLVLLGPMDAPKIIKFEGGQLKHVNPDERSTGALIQKALEYNATEIYKESTPGLLLRRGGLAEVLEETIGFDRHVYLTEDAPRYYDSKEFEELVDKDIVFVLGDHMGLTPEQEALLLERTPLGISLGPLSLHTHHCVTIVHNLLDNL